MVDDHPVNRMVAAKLIEKLGASVDTAEDGFAALERWKAHPSYDLVLMDWEMPELDGGATTRALRELPHGADVAVVALSGHAGADFTAWRDAEMDGSLSKPLSRGALVKALHATARGRPAVQSALEPGNS